MIIHPRIIIQPIILWLFPATVISIIFGTIYFSVQQDLRLGANDPQIAIAEDAARLLSGGVSPNSLVGQGNMEIDKSLSPFLVIYDKGGNPLISNAIFEGSLPKPPPGIFENVRRMGEERLTWQPRKDTRIATVVVSYQNASTSGFVLAGRSLKEVEWRESRILWAIITFWGICMLISFVGINIVSRFVLKSLYE